MRVNPDLGHIIFRGEVVVGVCPPFQEIREKESGCPCEIIFAWGFDTLI